MNIAYLPVNVVYCWSVNLWVCGWFSGIL